MQKRDDPLPLWRNVYYPPVGYQYFERPAAFAASPLVGKFNLLKAAWMADAAMLAYGRSGERAMSQGEVTAFLKHGGFGDPAWLGDWSEGGKGTQGYFAYTPDFAVLAFRGTEKDDQRDLVSDLKTWSKAESVTTHTPVPAASGSLLQAVTGALGATQPRVHGGFRDALDEVWGEASRLLNGYRQDSRNEIFFTGHSLGAALATLAISRFTGGNASLYTIGSPRTGNRAFAAKLCDRATLGEFRLVDNHDLVTRVPPAELGFSHGAGNFYRLDEHGALEDHKGDPGEGPGGRDEFARDLKALAALRFPIKLDARPPDDLYDHSPGRYCNRLWRLLP